MGKQTRQLRLGAFLPGPGHHVAAWRHPDTQADGGISLEHYKRVAQTAERGFIAFIVLLFGLFQNAHANAPNTLPKIIRFGVSSAGVGNPPRINTGWISTAQVNRALEQEFAKDGTKVEWIFFKGQGPAVNEAISNNQLDFTSLGDLPSIIGRSVGLDTRLVLVSTARSDVYLAVQPASTIKTLADLRGKRVAFTKGTASQLVVSRILATVGMTERDIKVINMDPATAKAAFLSGDIDAFFSTLDLLRLQKEGKARVIYSTKHFPAGSLQSYIVVNQKFASAYPQATQRVVNALVKSAHWASSDANRETVFKLWGSAGGTPEYLYRQEYQGIPFTQRLTPLFDPFIVARTKQAVEDAYRFKLIRKKFDAATWIDARYLNTALKELKLENHWPQFDANGALLKKI